MFKIHVIYVLDDKTIIANCHFTCSEAIYVRTNDVKEHFNGIFNILNKIIFHYIKIIY